MFCLFHTLFLNSCLPLSLPLLPRLKNRLSYQVCWIVLYVYILSQPSCLGSSVGIALAYRMQCVVGSNPTQGSSVFSSKLLTSCFGCIYCLPLFCSSHPAVCMLRCKSLTMSPMCRTAASSVRIWSISAPENPMLSILSITVENAILQCIHIAEGEMRNLHASCTYIHVYTYMYMYLHVYTCMHMDTLSQIEDRMGTYIRAVPNVHLSSKRQSSVVYSCKCTS